LNFGTFAFVSNARTTEAASVEDWPSPPWQRGWGLKDVSQKRAAKHGGETQGRCGASPAPSAPHGPRDQATLTEGGWDAEDASPPRRDQSNARS